MATLASTTPARGAGTSAMERSTTAPATQPKWMKESGLLRRKQATSYTQGYRDDDLYKMPGPRPHIQITGQTQETHCY
jgi:hypothetical protein